MKKERKGQIRPKKPRRKQRQLSPRRKAPCGRCGEVKMIRARGSCDACYVKYQRSGILTRLGPVRTAHLWSIAELVLLTRLRREGKTVRQCLPSFPNRSFWSLRLCCVSRKITRVVPFKELARATANTLAKAKPHLPGWFHEEPRGRPKMFKLNKIENANCKI